MPFVLRPWTWSGALVLAGAIGCGSSFSSQSIVEAGATVDGAEGVEAEVESATADAQAEVPSDAPSEDAPGEAETDAQGDVQSDAPPRPCGPGMSCVPQVETCCISSSGGQFASSCVAGLTCPSSSDIALQCESKSDCPGTQVCCIQPGGQGAISSCTALACTGAAKRICNPMAPATDCASAGQTCSNNIGGGVNLPGDVGACGN